MRGLVLLVAALLTASGAGQGRSADQPFSIHVSPARQTVDAGSGIGIEIVLTNTSAEPLDCGANISDLTGQDPNFAIDVQDGHGRPVPRRAYAHPELAEGHPVMNCSIAPGRSRAEGQDISRIFDMAKPGKYTIQVSRPISFTNPKAGVVTSNTVTVEVVPPPLASRSARRTRR